MEMGSLIHQTAHQSVTAAVTDAAMESPAPIKAAMQTMAAIGPNGSAH